MSSRTDRDEGLASRIERKRQRTLSDHHLGHALAATEVLIGTLADDATPRDHDNAPRETGGEDDAG